MFKGARLHHGLGRRHEAKLLMGASAAGLVERDRPKTIATEA
jgi:hypothetical protein